MQLLWSTAIRWPFADHLNQTTTLEDEIQQPSPLKIVRANTKPCTISAPSPQYSRERDSAASHLQAAFDDLLRSPTACKRPANLQKPLPSRPRSVSVPIVAELPAELPGSLLLENQGHSSKCTPLHSPVMQTTSQNNWDYAPMASQSDHVGVKTLVSESITHARSVPDLGARHNTISSSRSWTTFDSSLATGSSALDVRQERSRGVTSTRRRSRPDQGLTSPSVEDEYTFSASGGQIQGEVEISAGALELLTKIAAGSQTSCKKRRSRRPDGVSIDLFPLYVPFTRQRHTMHNETVSSSSKFYLPNTGGTLYA